MDIPDRHYATISLALSTQVAYCGERIAENTKLGTPTEVWEREQLAAREARDWLRKQVMSPENYAALVAGERV